VSPFLVLKLIHVAAVIVAVGANVSYVYWLRRAGQDRERLVDAIEGIRGLDRRVANPAYVVVLLSGLTMATIGPFTFEAVWIRAALGLYVFIVIFGIGIYAPAMRRQLAEARRNPSSDAYRAAATRSNLFGALAVGIVAVILVLMVAKPT
jgi:uncharacterized membrane protein